MADGRGVVANELSDAECICPRCGKPMERGFIDAGKGPMRWAVRLQSKMLYGERLGGPKRSKWDPRYVRSAARCAPCRVGRFAYDADEPWSIDPWMRLTPGGGDLPPNAPPSDPNISEALHYGLTRSDGLSGARSTWRAHRPGFHRASIISSHAEAVELVGRCYRIHELQQRFSCQIPRPKPGFHVGSTRVGNTRSTGRWRRQ
jgi:hypothetical protein